ncbi:MAG: hypothetical protein K9L17_01305 [Clostridiales bacterium]|nr:hypothetical protein [Clostridiales bacterium]MCF8021328.1 hypothetical protein [Clostridiales bacterium]
MPFKNLTGPARIFLALVMWGGILWLFTWGHPSLVPAAKFIFIVLVTPHAVVELLKDKKIIKNNVITSKLILIVGASIVWYQYYL